MRRRALAALLVAVAAGCGSGGGGSGSSRRFRDAQVPFTFSYPDALARQLGDAGGEIRGRPPRHRVVVGIDDANVVVVADYRLAGARPVEALDRRAFAARVDQVARVLAHAAGSRVTGTGTGRLAGIPSRIYTLAPTSTGRMRLVFAFRGHTQYFVRCQWDDAGADQIPRACDEVQRSFRTTRTA